MEKRQNSNGTPGPGLELRREALVDAAVERRYETRYQASELDTEREPGRRSDASSVEHLENLHRVIKHAIIDKRLSRCNIIHG